MSSVTQKRQAVPRKNMSCWEFDVINEGLTQPL